MNVLTMREDNAALSDTLAAFSQSGEGSSLYVLRAVTMTVDNMSGVENFVRAINDQTRDMLGTVDGQAGVLDPDDKIIDALERTYTSLEEAIIPLMQRKRASIDRDHKLSPGNRTLLHLAYRGFIGELETWAELCKALRTAIIHHDLAGTRDTDPTFDSPDELFQSFGH